jgi:uncharacterized tellurite resistance protein B-like protein
MRTYPLNSPQAAARIVTLAMLADGHLSNLELDTLDRLRAHQLLGLGRIELHAVIHEFCEDLLSAMHLTWDDACRVDPRTIAELMAEISDPQLRQQLLRICVAVAEADAQVTEGEAIVLTAAVEHWGLHRDMLAPPQVTQSPLPA